MPNVANHTSPILARGLVELAQATDVPEAIYGELRDALEDDLDDAWLDPSLEETFWRGAASRESLRDFPAYAPAAAPAGAFGPIELAVVTAPDVRSALRTIASTSDVLHGAPIFDLAERDDGSAALVYRSPHARHEAEGAMAAELALSSAIELVRRATGQPDAAPAKAFLVGPSHARVRSLAHAIGCGVSTHAALDRLELEGDLLDHRLAAPDFRMHRLAMRAITLERRRAAAEWTSTAARGALRSIVLAGGVPMSELARMLGLSSHAMRARLARESVRVRTLVDDARRAAADRLLLSGAKPSDVQRSLGYSDLASLRRACRRWWGMGPLARRALLDRVDPKRRRHE